MLTPNTCVRCGMRITTQANAREGIVRRWAAVLAVKSKYPLMYRLLDSLPLCAGCLEGLPVIGDQICQQCGRGWEIQQEQWNKKIVHTDAGASVWHCRDCQIVDAGALEGNRSLLRYSEWGKDLLGLYKYRGDERLSHFFGTLLTIAVLRYFQPNAFACIVAVPLHQNRLLERGFNQIELLADIVSKAIGVPARRWLQRTKETPKLSQQSGREARQVHMEGAFAWSGEEKQSMHKKGSILLLDDIYTTGSTLRECAETIRKNQSAESNIWSLTIYR